MSKRKRDTSGKRSDASEDAPAPLQAEDATADHEEPEDEGRAEGMAHLSPDVLSGSPDVFSAKPEPIPVAPVEPLAGEEAPAQAAEAAAEADEPEPAAATSTPPEAPAPPPSAPPPMAPAGPPQARRRGVGTSTVLGVVLIVIGVFAFAVVALGVDLTQYGWPLFVIIPGLTLLILGFVGSSSGASILGGILTVLGLVLGYQNASGDWASWTFAWPLVAPGGVGLGMFLQAMRDRNDSALRRGRYLIVLSVVLAMIFFVFFESIIGVSGTDYGLFGKAALPLLLIIAGVVMLVRSGQRRRA